MDAIEFFYESSLMDAHSLNQNRILRNTNAEGVTLAVAGLTALATSIYLASAPYFECKFKECCSPNSYWMPNNYSGLKIDLKEKLHGQHLVSVDVVKILKAHIDNSNPSKALVLSFHGWTGTGKNYVSKLIADRLFRLGIRSKFVHQFIATHDFPHQSKVDIYKEEIREKIKNSLKACPHSLFIFDEMDKMPMGLIDVLKPYLDFHQHINNVVYRKAIFLFLSNTGGDPINQHVHNHWLQGKKREDITLFDIERSLSSSVYKSEDSGLWHSELISKQLISVFVPFLPLELEHVKACIHDDLLSKGYPIQEDKVEKVASLLQYFPEGTRQFSVSGCKRVSQKVDYVFSDFD